MSPQAPSLQTDTRGVSPVIGVILMVAVTVILAAVIGVYVLGLGPGETAPTTTSEFTYTTSGNGYVTLESTNNANKPVTVVANGLSYGTLSKSGDRVTLNNIQDGDDVRLIYYYEGGSHQVEQYTYEYNSNTVEFVCDPSSGQLVVSSSASTSDCEYNTIQKAVDNASTGDTIQVNDGTYNENTLTVNKELNIIGESQNGVEIIANTPTTCPSIGVNCTVEVTGDNVDIQQLTVDATGTQAGLINTGQNFYTKDTTYTKSGFAAGFYGGTGTIESITVSETQIATTSDITTSTFTSNSGIGAFGGATISDSTFTSSGAVAGTGATIEGNTFTDFKLDAISVNGDDVTVRNNVMQNAPDSNGGIRIAGNSTLVEFNTIENTGSGQGITIANSLSQDGPITTGATIRNNRITNTDLGISFQGRETEKFDAGDLHTVTNNAIYDNTYAADDIDSGDEADNDIVNMQQNYWGHEDGANTNADCSPDTSRLWNAVDIDTSNALCTAPNTGPQ